MSVKQCTLRGWYPIQPIPVRRPRRRIERVQRRMTPGGTMVAKRLQALVALGMALIATGPVSGQPGSAEPEPAVLAGRVVGAEGEPIPGALVFICDQKTGVPIDRETSRPFIESARGPLNAEFAFAVSAMDGRFVLPGLMPGTYRLVGQRWPSPRVDTPLKDPIAVIGREVEACGVLDDVAVPARAEQVIVLRGLGTGVLHIDQQAPNDETLLLVSKAPLAGDPILGLRAWDARFLRGLVAYNRMPKGETIVRGLPGGKLYVAMFAGDNVPGFAAAEVEIRPDETTRLHTPFVAAWSDGRHDPPSRLRPLFDDLQAKHFTLSEVFGNEHLDGVGMRSPLGKVIESIGPLERVVDLPNGKTASVADLLAAQCYIDLQRGQARRKMLASQPAADASTYETALHELWKTLGARYPCFELKQIDWAAVGKELIPRAKTVAAADEFGLLCMELVARLEDSHAHLLDGRHKVPAPPLPRWSPGFACLVAEGGLPVVYHVERGGPAERAGMKIGMIVEQIDGRPVNDAIRQTMADISRYYGYSSERYLRYHAYRWFAWRHARGGDVRVTARDTAGARRDYELTADLEPGYLPRLPVQRAGIDDSRDVSWKMLDEEIGYIYVRRTRADLIASLDQAVSELGAARGLIIDVRGNSGGGFDSRRAHLNFTLDADAEEPERPRRFKGPIAVLIDARCISAGEGWASWFVANKRGRFFGEATAGASARKTIHEMQGGLYKVRFPVKAYRGFLGRPIERRGLQPDVPLLPSAADIANGRDTVLEAARAYLREECE